MGLLRFLADALDPEEDKSNVEREFFEAVACEAGHVSDKGKKVCRKCGEDTRPAIVSGYWCGSEFGLFMTDHRFEKWSVTE